MSNISGNASDDDIEVYQSSGEEWMTTTEKKRTTRRTSQRIRKKPRISVESSDSENEKQESRNKKKIAKQKPSRKVPYQSGTQIVNKDFVTGGFLVLKKDVQIGDVSKPPCLWRIDGKALLQKYEATDGQGKTLHRSTSIYTGWSPLDKDLYSPVNVRVDWHTSQQMTVELDWETLKNATMDSD